jgi:hypothetical protein
LLVQTFQLQSVPLLDAFKPFMKYITTIDFGKLTFEQDLRDIVAEANMDLKEYRKLEDSVQTRFQTARMVRIRLLSPFSLT